MDSKNNTENTWSKKRKGYGFGLVIFLFIFIISLAGLEKNLDRINQSIGLNGKVLKSIAYYSRSGKNSVYQIRIKFQGEQRQFEIDDYDYQNFNHQDFKSEVVKGDTVSIKYVGSKIFSLKKNGKEYCNIEKSNRHKKK